MYLSYTVYMECIYEFKTCYQIVTVFLLMVGLWVVFIMFLQLVLRFSQWTLLFLHLKNFKEDINRVYS